MSVSIPMSIKELLCTCRVSLNVTLTVSLPLPTTHPLMIPPLPGHSIYHPHKHSHTYTTEVSSLFSHSLSKDTVHFGPTQDVISYLIDMQFGGK